MKSSFMKLNHVSTFSGKAQLEIWYDDLDSHFEEFGKKHCISDPLFA